MNKKDKYEPEVLSLLGQEIYDFCQKHPQAIFNTPPDYQPEFMEMVKREDSPAYLHLQRDHLYQNRAIVNFFEQIIPGDMLIMLVAGKEFATIIAKCAEIQNFNDSPPNRRIIIHHTRNCKRLIKSYNGIWASRIIAASLTRSLSREMCSRDPLGKIFMKKVSEYGVTPERYRQLYPKLILTDMEKEVFEIKRGKIKKSSLYKVQGVSGGKFNLGKNVIVPGMIITQSIVDAIKNQKHVERLSLTINF